MYVIQFIAEYSAHSIVVIGGLWSVLFLRTYLAMGAAHVAFVDNLHSLRQKLGLQSESGVGDVLNALERSIESADKIAIGRIMQSLQTANDKVQESEIRRCDRRWEFLRSLIEVFPILGILGTAAAMASAASSDAAASERLSAMMESFGHAMYSTIAGLLIAVVALSSFGFVAKKVEQWLGDIREFRCLVSKAEYIFYSRSGVSLGVNGAED